MANRDEAGPDKDLNEIESLVNCTDNKENIHDVQSEKKKKKTGLWNVIKRHKKLSLLFIIVFVGYTLGLVYGLKGQYENTGEQNVATTDSGTSDKPLRKRRVTIATGAVASDHETCSKIGRDILAKGGSAVDSSIATLLCDGLLAPHSTGIGGGCFMVIYDSKCKKVEIIDGRETAPKFSNIEMFNNVGESTRGVFGAKFIGIPGEIMAFWKAHQKYGKLPWNTLFTATIKLAADGHYVSHSLARALQIMKGIMNNYPGFCDVFCDKLGNPKVEGDVIKRPEFAETLRQIAEHGPDYLYNSNVTNTIVAEIAEAGGVLVADDFRNYSVVMNRGLSMSVGDYILHTMDTPSGGPILGLILRILEGMNLKKINEQSVEEQAATYHTIIETFKLAYAEKSKLGDPAFYPHLTGVVDRITSKSYADYLRKRLDYQRTHDISYYTNASVEYEEMGTAQLSVLAPNGDAVSVTSTVNYYFGSMVISKSTGIIWNNEMADFSLNNTGDLQASNINRVEPGKRPLSSMVPSIFTNKDGAVQLVVGAAGGTRITTTVAQIVLRMLFMEEPVDDAVRHKRIHHQLTPNVLKYEYGFPQDVVDILKNKYGHVVEKDKFYMGVAMVISKDKRTGEITAFSDGRKIPGKAELLTKEIEVAEMK